MHNACKYGFADTGMPSFACGCVVLVLVTVKRVEYCLLQPQQHGASWLVSRFLNIGLPFCCCQEWAIDAKPALHHAAIADQTMLLP
jgi:hypothetical protein